MKIYLRFLLPVLICCGSGPSATAQDTTKNKIPCTMPEAKQFDFWVGEWDLEWDGANNTKVKGFNTIQKILGGCVIQENFKDPSAAFLGISVSMYNPRMNKWQQTWVDNQGSYLDFTGEFKDGKMTLQREFTVKNKKISQRMIFYNITEKQFDWNWEHSGDDGKTWSLDWKIHYTRKS